MGVIDRLRGLSLFAPSAVDAPAESAERNPSTTTMGEQRGDFMMLPPLRLTFGSMARLQHPIGDFLVTHRPTAVTNEPLAHGVEDGPLGLITARARRRPNRATSRTQRDALVHRERGDGVPDEPDEAPEANVLPPLPRPRRLAASAKSSSVPLPVAERSNANPIDVEPASPSRATRLLPTRAEVSRAVRGPTLTTPTGKSRTAPDIVVGNVLDSWSPVPFTAPEMPASTISNAPVSAPVLRRRASRGRVNVPIEPEDPDDALVEQVLAESAMNDSESSGAGSPDGPAAGEAWSGPTPLANARVRGAAPPEPASRTEPQDLQHRRGADLAAASPVDSIAASPASPTPPAESVASPIGPGPRGSTQAVPLSASAALESMTNAASISTDQRGSASTPLAEASAAAATSAAPAVAPAGRTARSRATLASRPPLVSPGTTGVQRRARDDSGGMRTATPTGLRATMPNSVQRSAGQGEPSSPGGARSVAVPEHVRQAVRESAGTAPSEVVVHEGGRAEALTRSVNAEAFTRDGEIFLAADAPLDSPRGQQLLAHELTHVVQQKGGAERMPAEHTAEGQDLEAGARHAEGLMQSMHQAPPQLHHRSSSVNAPAIPQMVAGEGVQRSPRDSAPPSGSPTPIASAPALSRGGPQPVNFLDD
ncbi:MAG: DUF4157 domain-containing protein, partial [Actinobacteria bacterium]|nr:DUF4157 domain-containing protein [Actinomycetota bacterium]